MRTAETTIANRPGDLARVTALVDELAASGRLASDVAADMNVALDEVLTNIIRHGYTDDAVHEIQIRLTLNDDLFQAEIEDDGRPFDPSTAPPPDLRASLRDRRVGGLGTHFVKRLMNEVVYTRTGTRNHLLLKRYLRRPPEADACASA